jgi:hypothetical protein
LFSSFNQMDMENIDINFIISDAGSNDENVNIVRELMNKYKNKLKIIFMYFWLDSEREQFAKENPESTFHSFPYLWNGVIENDNIELNDIYCMCDSSNVVNKNWIRAICSPHYIFHKEKLIIKSLGGDYTAESTIRLENENEFKEEFLSYEHQFHGLGGGRGQGISIKADNLEYTNQKFSCTGGCDDELIYRLVKLGGYKFIGHNKSLAIHRIHETGSGERKPNWAYKQLIKMYKNNEFKLNLTYDVINPIWIERNY